MSVRDTRAQAVGTELAKHPKGLTVHQLAARLGYPVLQVRSAIHDLRNILAQTDKVFVVPESQPNRQPWIYRLILASEGLDVAAPEGRWIVGRLADAQTRTTTMLGLAKAAVRATNGRTKEGQRARAFERHLTRLQEDLIEIDDRLLA